MNLKCATAAVVAPLVGAGLVLVGAGAAEAKPARTFANCTAMHKVYPHGVGKVGARDRTSGTPVTTFKHSNALYQANKKSDRDGDGVACEA